MAPSVVVGLFSALLFLAVRRTSATWELVFWDFSIFRFFREVSCILSCTVSSVVSVEEMRREERGE